MNPAYQGLEELGKNRISMHQNALYDNSINRDPAIVNNTYSAIDVEDTALNRGNKMHENATYTALEPHDNPDYDYGYGTTAPLVLGGTNRDEGAMKNNTYGDVNVEGQDALYQEPTTPRQQPIEVNVDNVQIQSSVPEYLLTEIIQESSKTPSMEQKESALAMRRQESKDNVVVPVPLSL